MADKRKFWWPELSKWDDHVVKEWIQWIELVAGLSAMIVLTWSLLSVWDGKSPQLAFSEVQGRRAMRGSGGIRLCSPHSLQRALNRTFGLRASLHCGRSTTLVLGSKNG